MTRAVRWAVAAGMLAVGVLAGCDSSSEGPDPTPTPSPSVSSSSASPSASPTPSPSASGPAIPAAAREKTDAGAEAFVKFFFSQVNAAWTQPREGLVRSLSDASCQFCIKTEADAKRLVSAGQRYESAPLGTATVRVQKGAAPSGQAYVRTDVEQLKVNVLDSGGAVVTTDSRKDLDLLTGLIWTDDGWRIYEVEQR